ncbi:MAG: FKBP-type peptidyl-prolyl cis-trans isomerase [Pirellulaceae bacterium]|nr:FKBP-type peptidyl-prolyl cis-trans isomerase [Pirellulaceae bacterium]
MRRLFHLAIALMFASVHSILFSQEPVLIQPMLAQNNTDSASYFIGYNVGRELLQGGFNEKDFLGEKFINGLMDALSKKKPAMSEAELKAAQNAIQVKLQARMAEEAKQQALIGEKNLAKAKEFLAANAKKDGVQTLKSGLQYLVIKKGQGKSPAETNVVRVNYEGKLLSGEVFDASSKHPEPAVFPVNRVIPGWTEALQRMAIGDKWQLFIPPDLAYGPEGSPAPEGAPGKIGPNEALIFEVELLEIVQ